jgi:hypothetical protein
VRADYRSFSYERNNVLKAMWISTVLTVLVFGPSSLQADGLIHKLPSNGSWVKYHLNLTESDATNPNDIKRATGSLTILSVGSETVDDRKCRWIEIQGTIKQENRTEEEQFTLKLLIPEKHLKKGGNPGTNILRGWRKIGRGEKEGNVRKLDVSDSGSLSWVIDGLLAGPSKETKKIEPKTIDFQSGRLQCSGLTGPFVYFVKSEDKKREIHGSMTTRFHERVPFGVASLEVETKEPSGDFIEMSFILNEFGKQAKSRLPDNK